LLAGPFATWRDHRALTASPEKFSAFWFLAAT